MKQKYQTSFQQSIALTETLVIAKRKEVDLGCLGFLKEDILLSRIQPQPSTFQLGFYIFSIDIDIEDTLEKEEEDTRDSVELHQHLCIGPLYLCWIH